MKGNPAVAEADKRDKPPVVQKKGIYHLADGNARRIAQDRTLLSVDSMTGRLMSYLQSSGQLDKTIVVYASDNGMMWGEHGLLDKRYPYGPSVRVPPSCGGPDTRRRDRPPRAWSACSMWHRRS